MAVLTIFNKISFLGLLLMLSNLSVAADCGDPSPFKVRSNLYGDIESRELTPAEYKNLDNLFKSLRGRKRGQTDTIVCTGKDGLTKTREMAKLNTEINYDNSGELQMITEIFSNKKSQREQLLLILSKEHLRMDNNNRYGDIEIISISKDELVFIRKLIPNGASGGRSVQERVISLNKHGIDYLVYYQGMLASKSQWRF